MKLLKTLDKSFLQFLKLVGFSNFLILLKGINNFPWVDSAFSFHFFFVCAKSLLLHWAFPSCRERGLLSSWGAQASHCGSSSGCAALALCVRAQQLQLRQGMWDPPRTGME